MDSEMLQKMVIAILPVIFAITFRESVRAFLARYFGDTAAYVEGRMTFNPIKHIDPLGTIVLPMICLALGNFLFGWAKPLPININSLRNPRRDIMWLSIAGPVTNLVMAFVWAIFFRFALSIGGDFGLPLKLMSQYGIMINISLMFLTLLPILPFDGGRIVESLLPPKLSYKYSRLEPYGMWIVLALIFTGVLGHIMSPLFALALGLIQSFIQLLM